MSFVCYCNCSWASWFFRGLVLQRCCFNLSYQSCFGCWRRYSSVGSSIERSLNSETRGKAWRKVVWVSLYFTSERQMLEEKLMNNVKCFNIRKSYEGIQCTIVLNVCIVEFTTSDAKAKEHKYLSMTETFSFPYSSFPYSSFSLLVLTRRFSIFNNFSPRHFLNISWRYE